jgi:hypothetical protein
MCPRWHDNFWGYTNLRSNRAARVIFFLILAAWLPWACTSPPVPAPDAAALLQNVPAADPAKFPDLRATNAWKNPYIVIRADRIGLLTGVASNEEQIVKPEQLLDTLARLPETAWPYGRAVAILVSPEPGISEENKVELRRKRGLVGGELESAHVAIQWIPAAGS